MKYRLIASALVIAIIGTLALVSNNPTDAAQSMSNQSQSAVSADDAAFGSFKK